MARSQRFQGRSQIRSPKRLTAWDSGPNQALEGQSAIGHNLWTTGVGLTNESMATIVRTRGQFRLLLDLATAAGDGFNGALGLGIVSLDAFNSGTAAVPSPFTDAEWPGWFWHEYWDLHSVAAQTQGENIARNAMVDLRIPIDSKAMRKLGEHEIIFGSLDVAVETGTASMRFIGDTRILLKLS